MSVKSLKKKLHQACKDSLQKRLSTIQQALGEAQAAANQETKSSAGDKHETGRAMMQLETEKLSKQLQEVLKEQDRLKKIPVDNKCRHVEPGALVTTDSLCLYFAISAGKVLVDGKSYVALSLQTPLGLAARGKQVGDNIELPQQLYQIKEIS